MSEATTSRINFGGDKPLAPAKGLYPPEDYLNETHTEDTPMSDVTATVAETEDAKLEALEATTEATETAVDEAKPVDPVVTAQPSTGPSIEELRAQQDKLNAEIAAKEKSERSAVVAQIVDVVKTYNVPVAEIVEALGGWPKKTRKGSPAKAKYKDPETGKTWTGRGKEPLWIRDKDRNTFLITE